MCRVRVAIVKQLSSSLAEKECRPTIDGMPELTTPGEHPRRSDGPTRQGATSTYPQSVDGEGDSVRQGATGRETTGGSHLSEREAERQGTGGQKQEMRCLRMSAAPRLRPSRLRAKGTQSAAGASFSSSWFHACCPSPPKQGRSTVSRSAGHTRDEIALLLRQRR